MPETIQYEVSDRIATVTINRPERRNAMTAAMNKEFHKKIREAGEDDSCLLYTSPSPRDRQKSRMPSSA